MKSRHPQMCRHARAHDTDQRSIHCTVLQWVTRGPTYFGENLCNVSFAWLGPCATPTFLWWDAPHSTEMHHTSRTEAVPEQWLSTFLMRIRGKTCIGRTGSHAKNTTRCKGYTCTVNGNVGCTAALSWDTDVVNDFISGAVRDPSVLPRLCFKGLNIPASPHKCTAACCARLQDSQDKSGCTVMYI